MKKSAIYETKKERERRQKQKFIVKEYLERFKSVMLGEATPNSIIQYLANQTGYSGEGVKKVLKREGVYKDKNNPLIVPETYQAKQVKMPLFPETPTASAR